MSHISVSSTDRHRVNSDQVEKKSIGDLGTHV